MYYGHILNLPIVFDEIRKKGSGYTCDLYRSNEYLMTIPFSEIDSLLCRKRNSGSKVPWYYTERFTYSGQIVKHDPCFIRYQVMSSFNRWFQ